MNSLQNHSKCHMRDNLPQLDPDMIGTPDAHLLKITDLPNDTKMWRGPYESFAEALRAVEQGDFTSYQVPILFVNDRSMANYQSKLNPFNDCTIMPTGSLLTVLRGLLCGLNWGDDSALSALVVSDTYAVEAERMTELDQIGVYVLWAGAITAPLRNILDETVRIV